jgi:uncharacterized membrane protein YphA (DoxX/SURF4 family)
MTRKITLEIITVLLFVLWVYAAISKLVDYSTFKVQLGKSPLLTDFAGFTAIAIPAAELVIAIALIFRRTLGLYASLFLMVMFTAYLVAILNFSFYIPCSCGGIIGKGLGWKAHIVFNLVFVALALIGIFIENGKSKNGNTDLSLATNPR